jgi:hypothetical protein
MARNTAPRFSKVTPKRLNTTAAVPVISGPPGVLSIAALEQMWHKPDAVIETWVANGDLARRDDYYFDRAEVARFNRERADLLA